MSDFQWTVIAAQSPSPEFQSRMTADAVTHDWKSVIGE